MLLNADLGENESAAVREDIMACLDLANIACGGHAGSPATMRDCLQLAARHGVRVGAHPGLPVAFGRGSTLPDPAELAALLDGQVGRFLEASSAAGVQGFHIKLHGTLYHATDSHPDLAAAYLDWVAAHVPDLAILARAGGLVAQAGHTRRLVILTEAFADRAYRTDGTLVPRDQPNAVISDPDAVETRIRALAAGHPIPTVDGPPISIAADTACLHADTPTAAALARRIRQTLGRGKSSNLS